MYIVTGLSVNYTCTATYCDVIPYIAIVGWVNLSIFKLNGTKKIIMYTYIV